MYSSNLLNTSPTPKRMVPATSTSSIWAHKYYSGSQMLGYTPDHHTFVAYIVKSMWTLHQIIEFRFFPVKGYCPTFCNRSWTGPFLFQCNWVPAHKPSPIKIWLDEVERNLSGLKRALTSTSLNTLRTGLDLACLVWGCSKKSHGVREWEVSKAVLFVGQCTRDIGL